MRAITGAEVTLDGGAHITLLVENRRGYANLCRLLTAAHAGTRRVGKEDREPLPPSVALETVAERSEGLVCLSGCTRRGLGLLDPNAAAQLAGAFGRERFFVELQRPSSAEHAANVAPARPRRAPRPRDGRDRRRPRSSSAAHPPPGRPRCDPLPDLTRGLRARAAWESRELPTLAGGNARALLLRSGGRRAERDARRTSRLRPDGRARLQHPDFSDGDEPAIRQLAAICQRSVEERYPSVGTRHISPLQRKARSRLEGELKLIDELGLAGFFLLHHEVLELARQAAREVRGLDSPRSFLPPGRGRGSSVGSIVCYLTGLSHVDPVSNELSLGRFLNRELASVPDIDLDFPRDIREKLIVAVTERYGREQAALVASFSTYRPRAAIRDVGKALGLPYAELERLARLSDSWDARRVGEEVAQLPKQRAEARVPAVARLRLALGRDRGTATSRPRSTLAG